MLRNIMICLLRLVVRTVGFHPTNSSSTLLGDETRLYCGFPPHGKVHEKVEVGDLEVKINIPTHFVAVE